MSLPYEKWKALLADEALPAAVVDLDAFDRNIARIRESVSGGKKIRVATKSIRIPALIRRIFLKGGPAFQGVMAYCAREAAFLHEQGFRDILIAYPTAQSADLEVLAPALSSSEAGLITLMVDSLEHVVFLATERRRLGLTPALDLCIDLDVSYRPLGIHLGVRRSSLLSIEAFGRLFDAIELSPDDVRLAGIMGYEAQIAGLPDANPFAPLLNPAKKLIRRLSARDVASKREAVMEFLTRRGVKVDFFNGGGTGSLASTSQEPWITEVTAGSGFLQPHLFDYYAGNTREAAAYFALRATRKPASGLITAHGGGIIGSGEIGPDKAPIPVLPSGLKSLSTEGFGEVQTPFQVPAGVSIEVGDPILCRAAKAGEPMERFREAILIEGENKTGRTPTYRGLGHEFQ